MREICEIRLAEDEGGGIAQRTAGTFILDNGKLGFSANPPYADAMFRSLMLMPAYVMGVGDVTAKDQPALWFHNLPGTFHGTYLWATMVT